MRQLVSEQLLSVLLTGCVLASAELDVVSLGVRLRAKRLLRCRGTVVSVRVDHDVTEVLGARHALALPIRLLLLRLLLSVVGLLLVSFSALHRPILRESMSEASRKARRMEGMRNAVLALGLAAAACGGGAGTGDDTPPNGDGGPGDGGPTIDGPPPGTPLDQRITVTSVTTPAGVMAGDSNWRIWGNGSLRISQVFTVPYADCGTLVGYTTGTATPNARVARLDANDALVATYDLGAFELRGLAAEPDGHFGALLWDLTVTPKQLHVTRFDPGGTNPRISALPDALAAPTDFNIGESRLEYGGGKYGAYFHVHGVSGFANGHEGDQLKWIDAASGTVTNGWSWGCSHSMSELIRYEPGANKFLTACVTDCYPGTSGGNFATDSIGGVYLDNARKVIAVDGGCNGSVAGELGGMAPTASGWKLVFNSHQAAATMGQASYSTATMNQDIGFASINASGTPGAVVWLTTTPGNEQNSTVSAWHPDGETDEQYVVGWAETSGTRSYKLGRVSGTGTVIEAPIDVTAKASWGERDDPFREHKNHDLVWAWFDAAGATSFHFARLASGQTAQCTAL